MRGLTGGMVANIWPLGPIVSGNGPYRQGSVPYGAPGPCTHVYEAQLVILSTSTHLHSLFLNELHIPLLDGFLHKNAHLDYKTDGFNPFIAQGP